MIDVILVPFLFLLKTVLSLAVWIVIADVLLNWLFMANIFNTNNRFIIMLGDTLERLTNIMLRPIQRNLPCIVGSLDLSPIVLILSLTFLENVVIRIIMKIS